MVKWSVTLKEGSIERIVEAEGTIDEYRELIFGHVPANKSIIEVERSGFPTKKEVIAFIEGQPEMQHDIGVISSHFLGSSISSKENKRDYNRLFGIVKRAQRDIAKKHGGTFTANKRVSRHNGTTKPFKAFVFRKLEK